MKRDPRDEYVENLWYWTSTWGRRKRRRILTAFLIAVGVAVAVLIALLRG